MLPKTALMFQPLFQGAVVLAIGAAILVGAGARLNSRGHSFRAIAAQLPVEGGCFPAMSSPRQSR